MKLFEVAVVRRLRVVAEDREGARQQIGPVGEIVAMVEVEGAIVFEFDGHTWASDGARIVRVDVALGAVRTNRFQREKGTVEWLLATMRRYADAPVFAYPLPGHVVPRGAGPWPSESEAVFTRRLTELDGATLDFIEVVEPDAVTSLVHRVCRVRVSGEVVGYAALQVRG